MLFLRSFVETMLYLKIMNIIILLFSSQELDEKIIYFVFFSQYFLVKEYK